MLINQSVVWKMIECCSFIYQLQVSLFGIQRFIFKTLHYVRLQERPRKGLIRHFRAQYIVKHLLIVSYKHMTQILI
jgi:hypothetical protein